MLSNIIYKSDILDGLFTEKDFEFLRDTNSKQESLENDIKIANEKRDKILNVMDKLDIDEEKLIISGSDELKEYVNNAKIAFENANKIISDLNNMLNEFNDIESDVLELVVKKDANKLDDASRLVNRINEKIIIFKEKAKQVRSENKERNIIINKFLNIEEQKEKKKTDYREGQRRKKEIDEEIDIELEDNLELRISEAQNRVYLPYTKVEIETFLENYPDEYKNAKDVIYQEFIFDISIYNKHPVLARFREAYHLCRHKEMEPAIDSLKFAMDMMFRSDINPTIIAAVKSKRQLDKYIECLENNELDKFSYFKIIYEVNPI